MAFTRDLLAYSMCTAFLIMAMGIWLLKTKAILPDPYLDEVFHVRQAQAYWNHQWLQWDPKITTPPGLYLISYVLGLVPHLVFKWPMDMRTSTLRNINGLVLFTCLQIFLNSSTFYENRSRLGLTRTLNAAQNIRKPSAWHLNLTMLNICLFPPVFFFSGLYYTDLAALLAVLAAYMVDLERYSILEREERNNQSSAALDPGLVSVKPLLFLTLGLAALVFRQTNIFWVAVFLGGLRVVRNLPSTQTGANGTSEFWQILKNSWELGQLYDPPVEDAYIEDFLKVGISLGIAALANIIDILRVLVPYVIILASFGLFVIINGSVVLGHKEFHSAGLHLPQMLYIWAYFMFFSWPIILLPWAFDIWSYARKPTPAKASLLTSRFPRLGLIVGILSIMLAIINFNTIVHPFTLADNRHYVFYVFRIIRRHPMIKFAVAPIYILCSWAVLGAFGRHPIADLPESSPMLSKKSSKTNSNPTKVSPPTSISGEHPTATAATEKVKTSFVLVWLISTTLSLITAPLVEPRYFIIPWVIWRLHVPPFGSIAGNAARGQNSASSITPTVSRYAPLLVEMGWYLAINLVTCYIFLYKGFEWPQEPGKVQRFMW